ncbi:MAG: hypothetical protein KTR14_02770 [Vampirovibrio sp.]|nr:hypothetical protein [Vampirovibrio sp.]
MTHVLNLVCKKSMALSIAVMATAVILAPGSALAGEKTRNVVKHSAIGAGVGAITGGLSERGSVLRGAGVGALTGAGTGVVDNSDTLRDRPLIRNTAKGAIIGTGVSATTKRSKLKGAAVGAGAGAGFQLLKDYLNRD